jgi:hypothetical protein
VKILKLIGILACGLIVATAVTCIGISVRTKLDSSSAKNSTAKKESNAPFPVVEIKPDGTATVTGPPVMSPGNIISIPVRRDRDHVPLSAILCVKCRTSLFVPGIGDKVGLGWIYFRQSPDAPPAILPTATEYSPGHHQSGPSSGGV